VLQFAVSGLLATIVIGVLAVALLRPLTTNEAIRDAKQVARLAGKGIVEPNLTNEVLAGDRAATQAFDRLVKENVLRDGLVRVKLWTEDGRVIYSDEPRLRGAQFEIDADELRSLRAGGVGAEVSDLSRDENLFERPEKKLLEVYLMLEGPRGRPVIFESYQRFSSISASGHQLWLTFAPALLGGLLLLQLVNLPLARSMARRLRDAQAQRETLLRRAIDSSDLERRRIAADLHDGVVQDLVGVSYELAANAERLNGSDDGAHQALTTGAARARDSVRALRALLVDIYPPSLHRVGLHATLADLTKTLTARGIRTTLDAPEELRLPPATEALLFRTAQEALRNAATHAGADEVRVTVAAVDGNAVLEVADDGCGFDPAVLETRPREGHLGLNLVRDLVGDAGGELTIRSAPGEGTAVRVEVPLQ
jgi:signal transduction histidine kinase